MKLVRAGRRGNQWAEEIRARWGDGKSGQPIKSPPAWSLKNDSGNRRQGGGGWGTPLKKRSATRIKIQKNNHQAVIVSASSLPCAGLDYHSVITGRSCAQDQNQVTILAPPSALCKGNLFEAFFNESRILDAGQFGIKPFSVQELMVGAPLHDLAITQNEDLAGPSNGA